MTAPGATAGNIGLGVTIDASDLRSELTKAVLAEMGPVLAELNAELRKTAREYKDVGDAADKSAERQINANNAAAASAAGLAAAVGAHNKIGQDWSQTVDRKTVPATKKQQSATDKLADSTKLVTRRQNEFSTALQLFGRESPEAEAAYKNMRAQLNQYTRDLVSAANQSRTSTDRQVIDYQRLARAADDARRSQEQAAKIAGIGTGGGGRTVVGGRGGRGSFLTGPGGMALGGLGAQALAPATLAVTNLAGAIVQLGQAGLVLPGIFAAAGASVGTAVIGFKGMGDAIGAMYKAAQEGASKADLKKAAEAIKDMDSNAKDVAVTIASDFLPAFKKIQSDVVQHNMFEGISKGLESLKTKTFPTVTQGLTGMSKAWNQTLKTMIGVASDKNNLSLLDRIFGNSAEGQKRANAAIAPMVHAMASLSSVGSEFLPRLGDGITKLMTRFDTWISKNVASGQMWKWIDEGLNGMRALGNSVLNIGKSLTGVVSAAGGDGGFLGWLEKATGQMTAFVNSTEGQAKIKAFFDSARDSMREWGPILKDLMKLIGDVISGFKDWGAVVLPILGGITHGLAQMPGLVSAAITAFAGFHTVKGLSELIGLTGAGKAATGAAGTAGRAAAGGSLASRLGSGIEGAWLASMAGAPPATAMRMAALQRGFGTARAVGGRLLAPATLIGAGTAAVGSGIQQDARTGWGQLLGAAGTIGGTALTGASFGSVFGPAGTAIGAGVGAVAGGAIALYNQAVNDSTAAAKAGAAAQADLAAKQQHAADTAASVSAANKNIADALLNSGGQIDDSTKWGVQDLLSKIPNRLQDQFGPDQAKKADDVRKNLGISDAQLAAIVSGPQDVFDAQIAKLRASGIDSSIYGTGLTGARDELLARQRDAQTAAPIVGGIAQATGSTNDQVFVDLHTLASSLQAGVPLKLDEGAGKGIADRLGQAGINLNGPVSAAQLPQIQAATGLVPAPGGGWMLPGAGPAQLPPGGILGALQQQQQAAGAAPLVPTAANAPAVPTLQGLMTGGAIPVQITNLPALATGAPAGTGVPQATDLGSLMGVPAIAPPPAVAGAQTAVADLSKAVTDVPPVKIDVDAPDLPKTKDDLTGIRSQMDDITKNQMKIDADPNPAKTTIDTLIKSYQNQTITLNVQAPPLPGHALGGQITGGVPGQDSVPALLMPGEHVLTTSDVARMGGQSGVYAFRRSLYANGGGVRHFATGGGVFGAGDGVLGGPGNTLGALPDDNSVIGLLTQIRDALMGKSAGSPLTQTAENTQTMANALGPKMKPFGGDVGKGALAGLIKGLGGDPNLMDWGGFNGEGQMLVPRGMSVGPGGQLIGAQAPDMAAIAAALKAFAGSGDTSALAGVGGLAVNSPVVRAITTARNKKKGALGTDGIDSLIDQVLTGGGFSGVLDPQNTPLVNALTTYQQKLLKPPGRGGRASTAGIAGPFDAALLSNVPAGQYSQTSAADLTKGLADCSSSIEDLVGIMDGAPTAGRSLSTANAPDWLAQHGFVPGEGGPGDMRVGFNAEHMQATLPDGTPFNWGSAAAAARGGVGGTGADDPAFTSHYYRPVGAGGLSTGLGMGVGSNPLGYSGGPVPVYIVDGPGALVGNQIAGKIGGQVLDAMGQPLSDVAGSIITGIDQGTDLERDSTKKRPATSTSQLMKEGNPLSVAALAGYTVPDFSRQGQTGAVMGNGGPGYNASGQMMSDTASLIMRTFTDTQAAADARQQQMMAVLDQIKHQLSEEVLKPLIQSAVQAAISAAGTAASSGTGAQMPGLAGGGGITGGRSGVDSVPALLMPGEHVLTTSDVGRMGGQSGVYAFRRSLYANGGHVQHFATGGGVNVDSTVGADFFGLSQVPIIGPIINLLVNILLKVIGVNVEAADTLTEISDKFDQFRGDFKAFDASGRLASDTSALSDRSGSSEQKAVDERVRIFKQVLTGLIQFIIQKIIIPITQAVLQTLLSTASSAVSGAITGGVAAAGGGPAGAIAGNLVGGLMNSAGGAAINIVGELVSNIAGAATGPIVDLLTGGVMQLFGNFLKPILSGGLGALITTFLPFLAFDEGGVANGIGMMPKATIAPERVLSPRQTANHERLTDLMDSGALDRIIGAKGSTTVNVHAPFTVTGGEAGARIVHDRLVKMIK